MAETLTLVNLLISSNVILEHCRSRSAADGQLDVQLTVQGGFCLFSAAAVDLEYYAELTKPRSISAKLCRETAQTCIAVLAHEALALKEQLRQFGETSQRVGEAFPNARRVSLGIPMSISRSNARSELLTSVTAALTGQELHELSYFCTKLRDLNHSSSQLRHAINSLDRYDQLLEARAISSSELLRIFLAEPTSSVHRRL